MKKLLMMLSLVLLAGCDVKLFTEVSKEKEKEVVVEVKEEAVGIANPASVNCAEKGGTLEILTDETGGQFGMCNFPNGKSCEEWAFFRGECQKELTTGEQDCLEKGGEVEDDFCIMADGMMCGFNGDVVECPDMTSLKAVPESILDLQEGLVVDGMKVVERMGFDEDREIGEYNLVLTFEGEKTVQGTLSLNEDEFLGEMWKLETEENLFPSLSMLPEFENKTYFLEGSEFMEGEQEVTVKYITITLCECDAISPAVVIEVK